MQVIEQSLEVELAERRAKKKKQDEEEAAKKLAADAALKQNIEESTSELRRQIDLMRRDPPERVDDLDEMGEENRERRNAFAISLYLAKFI